MDKTTNGSNCYTSTKSDMLDFFASLSTYRTDTEKATEDFIKAYNESPKYAMRALFYLRDIRNIGIGERNAFREIVVNVLNRFSTRYLISQDIVMNITNIPFFGRYDDMFYIAFNVNDTTIKKLIYNYLYNALMVDTLDTTSGITLLAKWCPSINTSSYKTRKMAQEFIEHTGMTAKVYRKTLSNLRAVIGIVEAHMSNGDWENIDYSKVPSLAMKKYTGTFFRRTSDRFREYLNKVSLGEEKMNASTLYPYDIVFAWANGIDLDNDTEKVKLAQWANMPSIDVGENDAIVVADTSGSMSGRPIATAIGLGLYFAEKNTGIWNNKMITFSEEARYFRLSSHDNVKQKIESLDSIVENTNICSVFELLYNTAIESKATKIPNIIIISDMQFDSGAEGYDETIYEHWRAKFEKAGLNMPNIVYWNVNEHNVSFQANSGVRGVQFACGHSINIFKTIMNNIDSTPYQAMIKTLDNKLFYVIKFGGNARRL